MLLILALLPLRGMGAHGLMLGSPCYTACFLKSMGGGGGCSAPSAPTGLAIDQVSSPPDSILSWTETGSLDGVEIWESKDGAAFLLKDSVGPNTGGAGMGTWLDYDAIYNDGFVHVYEVRATNIGVGCASSFSASVTNDIFYDVVYYNRLLDDQGDPRAAAIDTVGFGSLEEQVGEIPQVTGINNFACSFSSANGRYFRSANEAGGTLFSSDFTITFWIYCTSLPDSTSSILIRESSDDLRVTLDSSGNLKWYPANSPTPPSVALGSLNAWHLVVAICDVDGDAPYLSVDGGTLVAGSGDGAPFDDDYLSICPPGATATLDGRIDELSIWPRALSQAEVVSLYGGGTNGRFK